MVNRRTKQKTLILKVPNTDPPTEEERLRRIANIIESVEHRCMAVDGSVTPTTKEITEKELRQIYHLAIGRYMY